MKDKIIIIGDDAHGILSAAIAKQLQKLGQTVEIATLKDAYELEQPQRQEAIYTLECYPRVMPSTIIKETNNEPFYKQLGKRKGKKGYKRY